MILRSFVPGLGLLAGMVFGGWAPAEPPSDAAPETAATAAPLHEQIDELIEEKAIGPLAPPCSDADFIRRIFLDFTGVIPSSDQVRRFLSDTSEGKRAALIDRLLASPEFVRHIAVSLDVMLIERRADKAVSIDEWERYLIESIDSEKPMDQLFKELIFHSEEDETVVPAKFILNRDAEPNAVTRDVGRLVFGMDLQCAQCHDHPLVKDYVQDDYYGLYSFWQRTRLFTDPKTKKVLLSELADGEASFKSVFTGTGRDNAVPRPPKGGILVAEPVYPVDQAYVVSPAKDRAGKPKYSRRQTLAEALTANPQFRRNLANRLWSLMFGRGLVHPVDFHHTENPPVHPRLLNLLANQLAENGFQLRPLMRSLALTRAYQRTCQAPVPSTVNFHDIAARCFVLEGEKSRLVDSLAISQRQLEEAKKVYDELVNQQEKIIASFPALLKSIAEADGKLKASEKLVSSTEADATKLHQQVLAIEQAVEKTADAAKLLGDDRAMGEIVEKLKARHAELKSQSAQAAAELSEVNTAHDTLTVERTKAQQAFDQAVAARLRAEQIAPLERKYLDALAEYESNLYDLKATEQRLKIGELAAEYTIARRDDVAKAEAIWQSLIDQWTIHQQIAPLKPLSPEQFALSAMMGTGALEKETETVREKLKAKPPTEWKTASKEEQAKLEPRWLQLMLVRHVRPIIAQFVGLYGGQPGEDFQATVNQALFFGNGSVVDNLTKPTKDNLAGRLAALDAEDQVADELYLAILSRPATDEERREIASLLADAKDQRSQVIAELQWALLSSTEFRFNH